MVLGGGRTIQRAEVVGFAQTGPRAVRVDFRCVGGPADRLTEVAYERNGSTLRVDAGSRFPEPAPSGAATRHFQRFFCSNRSLPGRMLYRCASFVLDMAWLSRALLK